jgi:predicted small lipoprotein YifL
MRHASQKRRPRSPLTTLRAPVLAVLLLAAASCGQTGPLTLPGSAPPATGEAPPGAAEETEEDQTESDER